MYLIDRRKENNYNFFNNFSFLIYIDKIPNLELVVQKVVIPGISQNPASYYTGFSKVNEPGDIPDYELLSITFLIDEKLENYFLIYDWIKSLLFPNNYIEFREKYFGTEDMNQYSDISLFLLDNQNNYCYNIIFKEAFPTSLSGLSFDSTVSNTLYQTATATFNFSSIIKNRLE